MPYKNYILHFKNEVAVLLVALLSFITPVQGLFWIVGLAVFLDTFYAVYQSIKVKGVKSITSHNLFNSVVKTFFYMGTILMAYLSSVYITDGCMFGVPFLLPKIVCVFWLMIEIKSIDETNIKLGNKPFLETIQNIIKWLNTFKKDLTELKK